MKKSFLSITVILASLLCLFCACAPEESGDPIETTAEATETTSADTSFEFNYEAFMNTGNQIMYAYCDVNGDGECDDGANIFIREEPTTSVPWVRELFRGTKVTRISVYYYNGKSGDGWSRILVDEKTYYVQNRYLSEIDPGPGEELTIPQ